MARKYTKKASAKVGRAIKKSKAGTLRSGRSGKKVTSRKQAIAIGLSEARAEGKKVPPNKAAKKSGKKTAKKTAKKATRKTKTTTRNSATKTSSGRKSSARKSSKRKTAKT